MSFKQKISAHCIQLLNDKIHELENILQELSESATNNTKSSAGDKHETGRAMIQIEQETIGKQLKDAQEQKALLQKITPLSADNRAKGEGWECSSGLGVGPGSVIKTNKGFLFLSTALGKVSIDGNTVMVISPQSPLGMKLLGLKIKGSTEINGIKYFIESID